MKNLFKYYVTFPVTEQMIFLVATCLEKALKSAKGNNSLSNSVHKRFTNWKNCEILLFLLQNYGKRSVLANSCYCYLF